MGATGSVSHLRSEQEQLPLPRPLPTGSSGQDLSLQLDLLTENAYTFVDADLSGHMYTSGNDWPTGGANGVAAIQQKTYSCYQANPAAADQQQAIDNRENANGIPLPRAWVLISRTLTDHHCRRCVR